MNSIIYILSYYNIKYVVLSDTRLEIFNNKNEAYQYYLDHQYYLDLVWVGTRGSLSLSKYLDLILSGSLYKRK